MFVSSHHSKYLIARPLHNLRPAITKGVSSSGSKGQLHSRTCSGHRDSALCPPGFLPPIALRLDWQYVPPDIMRFARWLTLLASRPSHYVVLHNDPAWPVDKLRIKSFDLTCALTIHQLAKTVFPSVLFLRCRNSIRIDSSPCIL